MTTQYISSLRFYIIDVGLWPDGTRYETRVGIWPLAVKFYYRVKVRLK